MSRTPDIRFKGFLGDWERKTLGEIGIAKSGTGFPDKEQGGTQGIPFYKVSDMNTPGNETILRTANNYVSEEQVARNKWKPIDAVPAIFFAKVGAAVLLNRKRLCLEFFLLDNNTMAYSMNQSEWDTNYAKAFFDTLNLPSLCQPGPLPSYNAGDVEGLNILIPKTAEQKVIGQLFSDLDTLIEQNQSEVDRLRNLKKAMLQKMFPQKGSKVPEIRFKGFSGEWETKKLKNVMTLGNGKDYKHLSEGPIPVYGTGGYMLSVNKALSDKDAVGIGRKGTIDKPFILKAPFWTVDTLFFAKPNEDVPLSFLFAVFQTIRWMELNAASGVPSLSKTTIEDVEINIPTNFDEQMIIGQYFQNLDSLIEQRQNNTDRLRHLKQAMLQRMFV